MKVLVADDSRVMRQIVIRAVRQAGFEWDITEAPDGVAALRTLPELEPDLVLSDWNMPGLSGIELLRAMRARGDDTPFGFITSEGSMQMRDQADTAGALFLITKPFTADTLRDTIEPFLA